MTIVESIKCVLQQNNDGLTSKQIYDEIIRQGLYSFGAENPVGVVNAQLRRRCIGLDFPTAYPIKFFEIAGYEGKKIKFRLISTENTATIITAPKTTDISELLPEEKIKAALQEHLQNIRQQVFDSVLNNSPEFFEHLVVDLLLKMGYGYDKNSGIVTGKPHDGGIDGIIIAGEPEFELPVEVKQQLSAGEKQIFIMALYQALSQLNKINVPYIVDTPFARIDKEHRGKILSQFFKKLNGQIIILYDGIIDMRFAIPCEKLEEGDFHDKFGIFYKGNDALSFSGSINDSKHGFQNYESIKVFKTWAGTQEYVDADTARFEKIWNRKDRNLKMFTIPQAVKNKIFELRSPDRPYSLPAGSSKWVHQDIAVKTFLEKEHGILAMATGTGKTVTAMKIINKLFDSGEIRRVVITMYGNDLLDQWAIQIRENYKNKQINYHYASQKMMKDFVMHPDDSILILSRDARNLSKLLDLFDRLPGDYRNDTLFVFDEVHGAGSNTFVENLSGRLSPYRYRLGLSATPEREYDEAGNDFLLNEIGEVIFEFTLQDAIQKGILCEFNYIPLPYVLSDEEKLKKRKIIAAFNAKKESGEPVDEKDMFTQLALVNKTAVNKLEEFESLISQRPELLQKCIIFVQTMEYGAKLQEILVRYSDKYHMS